MMTAVKTFGAAWRIIGQEMRELLTPSRISGVCVLIFIILFAPHITRHTSDASMLASFYDDEPLITMQLDGMTAKPYGNPANYLSSTLGPRQPPAHWLNIAYFNIPYYGGLYLDMAFAAWVPLKLAGAPLFPTAPIILRVLTFLFSCCTILAACRLSRKALGTWAEVGTGFFLLTAAQSFLIIGNMIHPDTLLFFVNLLAVAIAARHVQQKDMASLLALGIVAGLAHSTKMGGPQLVLLVAFVVALGMRNHSAASITGWIGRYVWRGVIAMLAGLAVFFITTPYALFDAYYIVTWSAWSKSFTGTSPISATGFLNWCAGFEQNIRWPVLILAAAVAAWCIKHRNRYQNRVLLLSFAFYSVSLFLFYAVLNKYWVQMQYLVIPLAFVAGLAGHALDIITKSNMYARYPRSKHALVGALFVLFVGWGYALVSDSFISSMNLGTWRENPQVALGEWSEEHIEKGASVLWDLQAYFPVRSFPDQRMNGGPIKYTDFKRGLPDYFVLSTFDTAMWMSVKMTEETRKRWDDNYASMRLYQDLLGSPYAPVHKKNAVPGVTHVISSGRVGTLGDKDCTHYPLARRALMKLISYKCNPYLSNHVKTLHMYKVDKKVFGAYLARLEKEAKR